MRPCQFGEGVAPSGQVCGASAVAKIRWGAVVRDLCQVHVDKVRDAQDLLGGASKITVEPLYETPHLVALGTVESLVKFRDESLKLFRNVLRHADAVMGNLLPGAVLVEEFRKMRSFVDEAAGKKPAAPPTPMQRAGSEGFQAVPGFNHCGHGVPEFLPCQACKAEEEAKARAQEEPAAPVLAVPAGDGGKA